MRILFQGDSITDAARHKHEPHNLSGESLGCGYAMMVAAKLGLQRSDLDIRNLGISGNRIVDLFGRSREHIWNLKPDLLSILIGVNDTWHEEKHGRGVPVERYAKVYRFLLEETKAELPDLRLVLCEPFVLECGEVTPSWRPDIDERRAVVKELCADFDATLVPFQEAFDAALEQAGPAHWAGDGVHPTPAGHLLMAETWVKAVGDL
jgi:lysophospholipase L1-like esterase